MKPVSVIRENLFITSVILSAQQNSLIKDQIGFIARSKSELDTKTPIHGLLDMFYKEHISLSSLDQTYALFLSEGLEHTRASRMLKAYLELSQKVVNLVYDFQIDIDDDLDLD